MTEDVSGACLWRDRLSSQGTWCRNKKSKIKWWPEKYVWKRTEDAKEHNTWMKWRVKQESWQHKKSCENREGELITDVSWKETQNYILSRYPHTVKIPLSYWLHSNVRSFSVFTLSKNMDNACESILFSMLLRREGGHFWKIVYVLRKKTWELSTWKDQ